MSDDASAYAGHAAPGGDPAATAGPVLVGDIGGTNCRLALVQREGGEVAIQARRQYLTRDFARPADAIARFLGEAGGDGRPTAAALAVAGPVSGDAVDLTNSHWAFSQQALREELELGRLIVVNDLHATARAVIDLPPAAFEDLGEVSDPITSGPISVVAPGTGLGVALAFDAPLRFVVPAEGGHIGLAANDDEERAILRHLERELGRVINEHVISGPGLERLYRAVAALEGVPAGALTGPEIVERGLAGSDPVCERTVRRFARVLAAVIGDLVLAQGAREVVLAGSIVSSLLPVLREASFREAFEARGPGGDYMRRRRIRVTREPDLALAGAFACLEDAVREEVTP